MLTNVSKFRSMRKVFQVLAGVLFLAGVLSSAAVASPPPPTFSKVFSPDTIGPGSVSTLTFTIDNSANPSETFDELSFTDTLPPGVTLAAPAFVSNGCVGTVSASNGGDVVSLTDGMVGAGETCEIVVNVTAMTCAGLRGGGGGDICANLSDALSSTPFGAGGTASADLTIDDSLPSFSKSFAPDTVEIGGRSTLTFAIDNSGGVALTTFFSFIDTMPAGMVVADPSNAVTTCPL